VYNVSGCHKLDHPEPEQRVEKTNRVSFAKIEDFRRDVELQKCLLEWFPDTPTMFWSGVCIEHNGFFGSHTSSNKVVQSLESSPASSSTTQTGNPSSSNSSAGHQEAMSTYFRFIVKILETPEPLKYASLSSKSSIKDYTWHEMGFISFSDDTRSTILCFDVPDTVVAGLELTLSTSTEQLSGPFGLHVPLLGELVMLYDRSIWTMAKKVRQIEKVS
jgi:hypothetical protein